MASFQDGERSIMGSPRDLYCDPLLSPLRTPVDRTEGHPCYSQKGRNEEEAELLGAAGLFLFPVSPTLRMLLTR